MWNELPHPREPAQPLHPLLLLHPRRSAGFDGDAGGLILPFQATYYLNGHSFMERELTRALIGFRKNDNAFLASSSSRRAPHRQYSAARPEQD